MKKRIIAFVLSAIMVLSTVYPVQNVWADPDAEPEKQNETQVEVVTEQPGTESNQEQQAAAPTEKETEAPAPQTTEAPAPTEEQTEAPAPTEEQTEAPVEPTEPRTEDPTLPDIGVPEIPAESWKELTNAEKDVVVSGVLPVGTVLNGGSIPNPFLMGKNANALKGGRKSTNSSSSRGTDGIANWNYIAFYDLKLAADGENVQPDGSVQVTITNAAVKGKNVSILHILDNAEAITKNIANLTKVTDSSFVSAFPTEAAAAKAATGEDGCVYIELLDAEVDGESVSFTTNSFSIYAIVDDSGTQVTYRRTYVFKDINDGGTMMQQYQFHNKAGELVDNQILKAGEKLEEVGEPYHNGYTFLGWFVYDEATNTYGEQVFFEDDTNPTVVGTLTADETVIVHAKYEDVYYVTFHQFHQGADEDVIQTRKAVPAHIHRVLISDVVAPQLDSNHLFYGWSYGTTDVTIYDANNNITETYIENVTTNLDLYPYFIQAFWLHFVAGETGWKAKYVPGMFVKQTDVLTQLPVSEREGYTFGGWYTGSMTDGHITYEARVTDGQGNILEGIPAMTDDTTLYGYWIPNSNSTYTVVFWKQKVTDNKNATDAQKKYDYWSSSTRTGTTGDPALATNADITKNETGFHYGRTENNYTTIQPDGSTVVNVYYDRDLMVINFYYRSGAPSNAGNAYIYTATTGEGGTQYGLLPDGTYVELTRTGQPNVRVWYTIGNNANSDPYMGTFYTRSGGGGGCGGGDDYSYTATQYNGTNLPPNNSTTYYTQDGQQLYRHEQDLTEYTWTYTDSTGTHTYTGTRYTRSNMPNNSPYNKMVTWTGLWEQNFSLESNNYTWPSSHKWNESSNGGGTTQTFLAAFVVTDNPYALYDQGSTNDYKIYHYIQSLDGKYYEEEGVYRFTANGNGGSFHFQNKFEGFTVNSYNTGDNGYNQNGGSNTNLSNTPSTYPLHVYHTRNKHQIFYFSDGHQVYATGEKSVYFGAPMSTYNYTLAQVGLTERDHYTFEGWYADETCSTPYDFTGTMPNGNVTLYAKWTPNWYQIIVDPDGGIITSDIGSTYMWKQYGQTFDRYDNVVRTYIEDPNGAYKYVYVDGHDDPEGTNQVRTATYVPAEEGYTGTRYRPMTSSDPVYTLVDWYVVDPATGQTTNTPYDFSAEVEAPVWIRAVWQLTGAYQVVYNVTVEDMPYTDENGVAQTQTVSGTFTQLDPDAQYADGAEILLQGGPTNITSKFMFKGWQVVDDNGTVLDNNQGNLYHPGDVLKLKGSWANSARIIKIQPVYEYVPTSSGPVLITQLQLDANGGTTSLTNGTVSHEEGHVNSAGDVITRTVNDNQNLVTYYPVYVNERFDLNTVSSTFTREGFEFKGWNHEQAKARQGIVEFGPNAVIGMDNDPTVPNVLYAVWTRKIEVTKEWNDDDNRDGIRTTSVSITVDGTTKTLDDSNDWTATWTDLAEYDANGNQKDYAPLEATVPTGYTFSIKEGSNMTDGFTVVNTHVPETTTVTVAKTWSDDNNRDGVRPTTATVQLYKKVGDGAGTLVEGSTQTVGASANTWSYTWGAEPDTLVLYVYENGQQITYYVVETLPENSGYSKTDDGAENGKAAVKDNSGTIAITNSYDPQKITITVTKKWEDDSNRDGIRPTSLSLHLNGIDLTQSTIDPDQSQSGGASNEWTYTWTGLYKNERINGETKAIEYSVTEPDVPEGYELTSITGDAETGFTVTNTHVPETTKLTVEKVWDDENNRDGIRPAAVVQLYKQPEGGEKLPYGDAVDIVTPATGNWTHVFGGENDDLVLYVYEDGKKITYSVEETLTFTNTANNGSYEISYAPATKEAVKDDSGKITVTNKHVPEKINVRVIKIWNDQNNKEGFRPDSVTVTLMNGNAVYSQTDITAEDGWTYTWTGLYKYENGTEIPYTVVEDTTGPVITGTDGYTSDQGTYAVAVKGDKTNGFEITNTHTPKLVEVKVTKNWSDDNDHDGKRQEVAENTTVTLYKTVNGVKTVVKTVTGIPYDANSVTVDLGLDKLPAFEDGYQITYSVEETLPSAYYTYQDTASAPWAADVTATAPHEFVLLNTHPIIKTNVKVTKTWDDDSDRDGLRAACLAAAKVQLVKTVNGESTDIGEPVALSAFENGEYTFTDLPVYENGQKITYSVREIDLTAGYTASYSPASVEAKEPTTAGGDPVLSGTIAITNTHTPAKVDVSVEKIWADDNNRDGIRPESLDVYLVIDGTKSTQKVTLSESNNWKASIPNLYKFHDGGSEYAYTWDEGTITGYELTKTEGPVIALATPSANEGQSWKLTNTHVPEKVNVTVTKIWDDDSDRDGLRKNQNAVKITLNNIDEAQANDINAVWSVPCTNGENSFSKTWEGLYKYQRVNGVTSEIEYTVTETGVTAPYTAGEVTGSMANGFEVKNSYTPERITVKVTKVWDDDSDRDGVRANQNAVITIGNLDQNDVTAAWDVPNMNDANSFEHEWTNLFKYHNHGEEIAYTVSESGVTSPYVAGTPTGNKTDGFQIKNSYAPETVTVKVTKVWDDGMPGIAGDENRDGIRPDSVDVVLKGLSGDQAEGGANAVQATKTLNADGSWTYTWTGLYKKANGVDINYSVEEVLGTVNVTRGSETVVVTLDDGDLPGHVYNPYHNGYDVDYQVKKLANGNFEITVTNKHFPDVAYVEVTKTWNDDKNRDGIRPETLSFTLTGSDGSSITRSNVAVAKTDEGAISVNGEPVRFTALPVYDNGVKIVYTLTEGNVNGYTANIPALTEHTETDDEGFVHTYYTVDVTNTHELETVNVTVNKIWNDNNNQDGIRPDSVEVVLHGLSGVQLNGNDQQKVNPKATLSGTTWSYTWEGLFKNENGEPINYTVTETLANATVQRGSERVTVAFTMEDPETDRIEYNPYHNSYGAEIKSEKDDNGNFICTVTNTHVPDTTSVEVTKTWDDDKNRDGIRPTTLSFTLTGSDGSSRTIADVAVDTDDTGAIHNVKFTGLPVYKDGVEIVYTLTEAAVEDYTTVIPTMNGQSQDDPGWARTEDDDGITHYSVNVENTHTPETVDVTMTKVWDDNKNQDGKRPDYITVNLLKGNPAAAVDQDGIPASVKIGTAGEGVVIVTPGVDDEGRDTWTYTWTGLYKNERVNGTTSEIVYSVTEDAVANYDGTVNGWIITNKHDPVLTSITVTKVWKDNKNQDGKRPESLDIELYMNGELLKTVTVNPNSDDVTVGTDADGNDTWTYTFTNLEVYHIENGTVAVPNEYQAKEETFEHADEYTCGDGTVVTASENENSGTSTITNSYQTKVTEVPVKKVWNDDNDRDGIRPESITVQLYADGELVKDAQNKPVEITLNEGNNWSGKFTGLDAYKNGQLITYTVKEVYTEVLTESTDSASTYKLDAANTSMGQATVDQTTKEVTWSEAVITNVHTPETVEITITKIWVDNGNSGNTRPEDFLALLHLYANGTEIPQVNMTVVKSETGDTWTYTFKGTADHPLYKYTAKRQAITYKFEEDEIKKDGTVVYGAEWNPQEITSTDDLSKFKVTNTALEGELVIAKQFTNNTTFTDDQSFVFHVTGPNGATTVDRTVVVVVKAGKSYGYVTITQIPIGTYTVTEDGDWSWRWEANATTPWTANNVKDGKPEVLPTQTTTVIFNNDLTDENWLSDTAYARNIFTGASGSTGSALPAPEEPKSVAMVLPAPEVEDDKKKREEA